MRYTEVLIFIWTCLLCRYGKLRQIWQNPRSGRTQRIKGSEKPDMPCLLSHPTPTLQDRIIYSPLICGVEFKGKSHESNLNIHMLISIIIIVTINGLSSPVKRHGLAEWIEKQNPSVCCLHSYDACEAQWLARHKISKGEAVAHVPWQ